MRRQPARHIFRIRPHRDKVTRAQLHQQSLLSQPIERFSEPFPCFALRAQLANQLLKSGSRVGEFEDVLQHVRVAEVLLHYRNYKSD